MGGPTFLKVILFLQEKNGEVGATRNTNISNPKAKCDISQLRYPSNRLLSLFLNYLSSM